MEKSFAIILEKRFDKILKLKKKTEAFVQLIKQSSGGCLFAEYDLTISPNNDKSKEILLTIEADEESQIKTIEYGITKGIREILQQYENREIDFYGMNISVKSYRFHVVDSNPTSYEISFKRKFYAWIEENCFEKISYRFELDTQIFKLREVQKIEEQMVAYPLKNISINCTSNLEHTLIFIKNWKAEIVVIGEDYKKDNLKLAIDIIGQKRNRQSGRMVISFGEQVPLFIANSILSHAEAFKDHIFQKGYNLGDISIFVNCASTWPYMYAPELFFNPFGWLLENITSDEENFEVRKMRPVNHA